MSFDNTKFSGQLSREEIMTNNEDECATACLQKNYCEHFVFYKSLEPINTNNRIQKRKNCVLSANSNDNIISCRLDSICANLLQCIYMSYESFSFLYNRKIFYFFFFKSKIRFKIIRLAYRFCPM